MGERLVGVGHAVDVFAAAHGGAFAVVGGDEFVGQLLGASAGPSFRGSPSGSSESPATAAACDSPASAPGRRHRRRACERTSIDGFTFSTACVKTSIGSLSGTRFFDDVERIVEHVLRDALLAVVHQAVDELAGQASTRTRGSGLSCLRLAVMRPMVKLLAVSC